MRYAQGIVQKCEGALAIVEVAVSESGCGRCHEPGGCASQNISRSVCKKQLVVKLRNRLDAKVGESVFLGIDEDAVSKLASSVYLVPLLAILAASGIGEAFSGPSSVGAVLGAIIGGTVTLFYFAKRSARFAQVTMISGLEATSNVKEPGIGIAFPKATKSKED